MLVLASVTGALADFATNVVGDLGLAGVFVLSLLGSACIPIPSEVVLLFGGFNVAKGEYSLLAATLAGVAGNVVGSWIAYAVGYYGRMELVERHGDKLHVSPSRLALAERWFQRWGPIAVLLGRLLPIVRAFISVPAGVARMAFWRFTLYTAIGSIPWCLGLVYAGQQTRHNWTRWKDALHYVDYVVLVLLVAGIVVWIVRRRRGGATPPSEPPAGEREPAADLTA
ncbi:MAG TPA: DedA family protein [Conexibacter sp.]|nr:DedA family protein [Conexibacter sp.]